MLRKKLLLISLGTVLILALFHIFALELSWYYIFRWSDIPVHILGGFWVTITSFWLFLKHRRADTTLNTRTSISIVFISVLVIGVLWEIFELASGNTSISVRNYWPDTFTDVASGFIGGVVAGIYFSKLKNN